jgi:hypothetical protein
MTVFPKTASSVQSFRLKLCPTHSMCPTNVTLFDLITVKITIGKHEEMRMLG